MIVKKTQPDSVIFSSELIELMEQASSKRDAAWGKKITYSRKVFAPLTNMCRDTCGYCTFVKHPNSLEANIMTPDEVLRVARKGEQTGCKEILFSLGEKPEIRYAKARKMLNKLGYSSMTNYLRDMCAMVLDETTLLPHVNAGTLSDNEIDQLKPVSASMGMMLETVSRRLSRKGEPHYACPDKVPLQRLRTLERAGQKKVPFTTGLLIGIGETWEERVDSLTAINEIHKRYGNIQEVIIQNFQTKPDIEMANHPEPSLEDMLRTIATARILLDDSISIQAPPNLSLRHIHYLKAGINDWGGISPVTIDFINPQHSWPEIRELEESTSSAGYKLHERLTVYPNFLDSSHDFLNENLYSRVIGMAREDGLSKDQSVGQS
jgi:FO synthase